MIFMLSTAYGETVYFLVADPTPGFNDSYVLPLTDANDIAHARDLIAYGPGIGQPIVMANIACGMNNINRDYLADGKPNWAWHVTSFINFADISAEIYDGYPGGVHSDCQWWINNTGGKIGFWGYTVVAELGTNPYHWIRDYDSDNDVDMADYSHFGLDWMRKDCAAPYWCSGTDINHDGAVDFNDLRIFAESWLSPFAEAPDIMELPSWFSAWDCRSQCHGNANCAGRVDTLDMTILSGCAPLPAYYGDTRYNPAADFNRDYVVDSADEAILNTWFMKTPPADCPQAP